MVFLKDIEIALDDFLDRRIKKASAPSVEEYFEEREERINDEKAISLKSTLSYIHDDLSALLTHISAMIAALGITLIVFQSSRITQVLIFLEIISYAMLAIMCVFSLRHKGGSVPVKEKFGTLEEYYQHYLRRRYFYITCSNGVILTTIIFMLTIILHLLMLIFRG